MTRLAVRYCASLIWLVMGSSLCRAQLTTTGTISGRMVDPSGLAVVGAKVSLTNTGAGDVTEALSNSAGSFSKVGLPSGHYAVAVASAGFNSFKEIGIYLEPAGTYTVNVALQVGSVTTAVTVSPSSAAVQTSTSEVSSTVSGEEMEALPLNGRNYQGVGSLMRGVVNMSPQSAGMRIPET